MPPFTQNERESEEEGEKLKVCKNPLEKGIREREREREERGGHKSKYSRARVEKTREGECNR